MRLGWPITRLASRKRPDNLTTARADRVPPDDQAAAIEFAWQIHASIRDWTALADIKASIMLPLESAIFAFIITQSHRGGIFGSLSAWRLALYWCGIALILLATLSAATAIVPRLDRGTIKNTWQENFIYFGHLRLWDSKQLTERLREFRRAELDAISASMISMSKTAWRKHQLLQASISSLVCAILLLVIVAVT